MKTMRNNLWMVMTAWCLMIEGRDMLALVVTVTALIYLYLSRKYYKISEMLALSCLFVSVGLLGIAVTSVGIHFSSTVFLVFVSFNAALSYEYLCSVRLKSMYCLFTAVFVLQLIMTVLFIIMPITLMNTTARFAAIMLVNVIFMPYTLILLIRLIQREYRIRTLRSNLETLKNRSMFDIKI